MKITAQQISSLLQHIDTEGYIKFGAPVDEYASEAEVISRALSALKDDEVKPQTIEAIILEVWQESFDLTDSDSQLRHSSLKTVAERIFNFLKPNA